MLNNSKLIYLFVFCVMVLNSSAQQAPENLVFEGAGIRGIAYCGALMELDERGMLKDVKRLAGTSSGSITACLLAVGYTPKEIEAIIGSTKFEKFNDGRGGFIGGSIRLKRYLGYYKGNAFLHWIEHLVLEKTGNADLTFSELANLSGKDSKYKELVVAATCLNHQETIYFSKETFPHMRIVDAVRASMAVPLYFEPLFVGEDGKAYSKRKAPSNAYVCVDGGFTANFPIQVFDQTLYCEGDSCVAATLGLRIDNDEQIARDQIDQKLVEVPIEDTGDFVKAFYYIIKETMNRTALTEKDWERTISISDAQIGPKVKALSEEEKRKLIDAGRAGVKSYFGS